MSHRTLAELVIETTERLRDPLMPESAPLGALEAMMNAAIEHMDKVRWRLMYEGERERTARRGHT